MNTPLQKSPLATSYLAGPDTDDDSAQKIATDQGHVGAVLLKRRGTALGWLASATQAAHLDKQMLRDAWHNSRPYILSNYCTTAIPAHHQEIEQSRQLMETVAQGAEMADLIEQVPYADRLSARFEMLSAFQDESDLQEIETIEFDAIENGEIVGENLWCKASWLSYEDDDASLRFRFSFGIVGYEDVAADTARQRYAGELTEAIFPESAIITADKHLEQLLCETLSTNKIAYVERIIYFNAPNGGAQFHQDVERGHLGVVFAQLRGRTGWLACSKSELMDEIENFVRDNNDLLKKLLPDEASLKQLTKKSADRTQLNLWLDDNETNEPLELLLNRCPEFIKQLADRGYAYIINPGDIILLPQKSLDECAWHTVFCLDDFPGESLSFAVREI